MKVAVIGMGYVGIPAAALFADVPGFTVIGIQRRSRRSGWKIDALNRGENPIGGDEPGLAELIQRVVVEKKTFRVSDDITEVKDCDAILIDVQTPTDADHVPRYESLKDVSKQVGEHMPKGALVVIESTVAPGTTKEMVKPILEEASGMKAGEDFGLAFAYERVMVGRLLYNITDLPRIVGGIDEQSTERAVALYKNIVKAGLHATDSLTAEVAKTVENTYRDVNIAFANEVGLICESLGIDSYEVRELVNTLPNIPGDPAKNPIRNMHVPGIGVGGHCLPKDSWLLKYGLDTYGKIKVDPKVIVSSRNINDWMPIHAIDILENMLKELDTELKGSKIVILGLAFLPDCDDPRNSPTYILEEELRNRGANPIVHDGYIKEDDYVENLTDDLNGSIADASGLILSTAHPEYVNDLDIIEALKTMKYPALIDGRSVWEKKMFDDVTLNGQEIQYQCIGKGE